MTCLFCDSTKHNIFDCIKSKKKAIIILVSHIETSSIHFNQQNYKYSKQDLKACLAHFVSVASGFGDEVYNYLLQNITSKNLYKMSMYKKTNLQSLFSIVNNLINKIVYSIKKTKKTNECPICYENYNISNMIATPCNHLFCKNCIKTHATTKRYINICCPLCRYDFNNNELIDMEIMPITVEIRETESNYNYHYNYLSQP